MAEYFMGQVMMTGFGYAQKNFAACNGGLLNVSQNAALYSLLGITFGGNGTQTFGLPDLRSRTPVGGFVSQDGSWQPTPYVWGQIGGVESVSLTGNQNGPHTHGMSATTDPGVSAILDGPQLFATNSGTGMLYGTAQPFIPLGGGPTSMAGSGAPHDNMQPYEAINFNIALVGIYPSRS